MSIACSETLASGQMCGLSAAYRCASCESVLCVQHAVLRPVGSPTYQCQDCASDGPTRRSLGAALSHLRLQTPSHQAVVRCARLTTERRRFGGPREKLETIEEPLGACWVVGEAQFTWSSFYPPDTTKYHEGPLPVAVLTDERGTQRDPRLAVFSCDVAGAKAILHTASDSLYMANQEWTGARATRQVARWDQVISLMEAYRAGRSASHELFTLD